MLTFPITGGNVKYFDPTKSYRPYVQGEIDHMGSGISLSAGGKKVDLTNFVIDPGNNSHLSGDVSLNGKSVVKGANLFRLDGTTLKPALQGRCRQRGARGHHGVHLRPTRPRCWTRRSAPPR